MYNIKKAVSRLDFAPKIDYIKITDIKRGLGDFTPKADKAVSFAILKEVVRIGVSDGLDPGSTSSVEN